MAGRFSRICESPASWLLNRRCKHKTHFSLPEPKRVCQRFSCICQPEDRPAPASCTSNRRATSLSQTPPWYKPEGLTVDPTPGAFETYAR